MPYSAEISRLQPTCFIFLIDQTGSMAGPFGSSGQTKAVALADAVNRMLQNFIIRCAKEEGIRDYFNCAILGFGRRGTPLGPAWIGPLRDHTTVSVSIIAERPLRIEEREVSIASASGSLLRQIIKFPVWIEPVAEYGQPAPGHENLIERSCEIARSIAEQWTHEYPNGYPPTVVLITDGGEEGGDPILAAKMLKSISTSDGAVLLSCCHISQNPGAAILFPDSEKNLPDNYARMLFRMSSPLPPGLIAGLHSDGIAVSDGSRGFVFNADLVGLIRFLDIGTRISQMVDLKPGR